MSYLVRIIATRRVEQDADVLLRVPDYLDRDTKDFDEYVSEMVYDIAKEKGLWATAETLETNWQQSQMFDELKKES